VLFCGKCGNSLKSTDTKPSFDKPTEGFAEEVGRIGKEAGKKIEDAAQRFGKETQEFGKRFDIASKKVSRNMESWYDRTFGVFGPLVSSFVVLIILRLAIVALNAGAEETPVLADIGNVLLDYLLLIFLLVLIGSYSSYIAKKYKPFRWATPVIIAVLIVFFSTIALNIIGVIGQNENIQEFIDAETQWRENYMVMIFVIIVLLGYLINIITVAFEKDQKK
jgi:hypothetical protein